MTDTWQTLYDHAVQTFGGQTPGRQLEEQMIAAYEQRPQILTAAIQKIGDRYTAGKVHSPWGLIARELDRDHDRTLHLPNPDDHDKDRQIRLAETYIRNAALYLPSETELEDDLFGPHGRLKQWAADTALRDRMLELWRAQQPRVETAERQTLERAERWKATRPKEAMPVQPSNSADPGFVTPAADSAGNERKRVAAEHTPALAAHPTTPEDAGPPDHENDVHDDQIGLL